jgi:adenosine deaminase
LVSSTDERFYSIFCLIQMAASLRLRLFRILRGEAEYDCQKERKALKESLIGFDDEARRMRNLRDIKAGIGYERNRATASQSLGHRSLDYAIREGVDTSIYSIHAGERAMLYHFFYRYFRNEANARWIADYMYLYLLLKVRVRREFIQTNTLYGLENFQTYEHRKSSYSNVFKALYPLYAVQSTLRTDKDAFEARVTTDAYPQNVDYSMSLFQREKQAVRVDGNNLHFVIHLIKKSANHEKSSGKRYGFRDGYKAEIDQLLQKSSPNALYPLVGLDVAGSELHCPPEAFGQAYRYARRMGIANFTYHVGEDFVDLADGLRRIQEAIDFLELDGRSRLGHALALGVNPRKYYQQRHNSVVMDCQRLLDTLTWLLYKLMDIIIETHSQLKSSLLQKATTLYHQIGYPGDYQPMEYYLSQQLRSDGWGEDKGNSAWSMSRYCQSQASKDARSSEQISLLHSLYRVDSGIIERGKVIESYVYPSGIEELVEAIQATMRREIAEMGITIECNPTSNVKIGPFDSYDEHPIFLFKPPVGSDDMPPIPVAICTDDKGIFGTSLPNEYSLIASAMRKRFDEDMVVKYLDEVRECAWGHRF